MINLQNLTWINVERMTTLCNTKLISILFPLLTSRSTNIKINDVVALVKLWILLIIQAMCKEKFPNSLNMRHNEAWEHVVEAILNLISHDENNTAIRVLGVIPLHLLPIN